jgi:hypothetical protein
MRNRNTGLNRAAKRPVNTDFDTGFNRGCKTGLNRDFNTGFNRDFMRALNRSPRPEGQRVGVRISQGNRGRSSLERAFIG